MSSTAVAPVAPALPEHGSALAEVEAELAALEAARKEYVLETQAGMRWFNARIRELRTARARLTPGAPNPVQKAGRANVERARQALEELGGRATQAEIRERMAQTHDGLATVSMTWVMRALEQEGLARPTGERRNTSREYELLHKRGGWLAEKLNR